MEGENENKKGLWTKEEDRVLLDYIRVHGRGRWNRIPKVTGLKRSGKSCRLRWLNYLSPNVKRGDFSEQEEDLIIRLHNLLGNRWSLIARRVPGRTDNQVKNYWNSHLCKKLGIQKQTRKLLVSPKSSDDHSASVEEGEKLLPAVPDSNSKQSYCSRSTSTSSSVKDMELESMKNDENSRLDVGDEEIEWMTKHCAESPFCCNYDSLSSWGVVEFLQGYPLDLL